MSGPPRRAGLFVAPGQNSRHCGPTVGDERSMLLGFLRDQRNTLERKCAGVDGDLSRRAVQPCTLSLLGLVRHLADVERRWFRQVLAGQDARRTFSCDQDPDADFNGATPGARSPLTRMRPPKSRGRWPRTTRRCCGAS
ncbi:MAG: DUF664 domain-containing protein [Pseudonocardiales bacterium]